MLLFFDEISFVRDKRVKMEATFVFEMPYENNALFTLDTSTPF